MLYNMHNIYIYHLNKETTYPFYFVCFIIRRARKTRIPTTELLLQTE